MDIYPSFISFWIKKLIGHWLVSSTSWNYFDGFVTSRCSVGWSKSGTPLSSSQCASLRPSTKGVEGCRVLVVTVDDYSLVC